MPLRSRKARLGPLFKTKGHYGAPPIPPLRQCKWRLLGIALQRWGSPALHKASSNGCFLGRRCALITSLWCHELGVSKWPRGGYFLKWILTVLESIFKKPHLAATWRHHVSGATVRRLGSKMAKFCLHSERLTGQVTKRGFSSHLGATNASPGRQKWGFRCDVHGVMILPL